MAQAKTGTLYQRLGGYDAIAAVADDFMGRLASDPQLARWSNNCARPAAGLASTRAEA